VNKKVLFLGEADRADAQTWIKGLRQYGGFDVVTWELPTRHSKGGRFLRMMDWLNACFFLRKKIKLEEIDLVAAYRVTSYGFIGAMLGKRPLVIAQQGITDVWPLNGLSTPFKAMLGRFALKKADLIHAWGEVMVPAMLELGADQRKILVAPKGIDNTLFYFDPASKPEHGTNRPAAIVTRSLAPDYRHSVILKALKRLKDRDFDLETTIVGDGSMRQQLEAQTISLGLQEQVRWTGRIPNDDLPDLLRRSNLYISVPITEGVSASLLEAMACGCFPIVTDLPGNRAWITHGENGFLVPVDDEEALASYIIRALEGKELVSRAIEKNLALLKDKATFQNNFPVFAQKYRGLIGEAQN
jgi:glycosyltransferase involved in cell wall biosynthesis